MSSIDEIIQAPGEEYDLMRESIMRELHVATPGIIQSFDNENQTAVIKPVIRSRKDGKNVDMPMLTDVPVFFPGGSAGEITYPVNVGDECLVIFADGCIDGWFQNGGVANAISLRKHDYSDGFAFVGFRSKAKKIDNFPSGANFFGVSPTGQLAFGTVSKTIKENLEASWTSAVPNDGKTYNVVLTAMYGNCFGFISRYSNNYGAGMLMRYDGKTYGIFLNAGAVTVSYSLT